MKKIILGALLVLITVTLFAQDETIETMTPGLYAKITTSKGDLLYSLDYKNTPLTVLTFVMLSNGSLLPNDDGSAYLENRLFNHDIINYAIFIDYREGNNALKFFKEKGSLASHNMIGTLSMLGNVRDSIGNQFFIMKSQDEHLDSLYTPFGLLIEGENILSKLKEDDTIISVEIFTEGSEAEFFQLTIEHYQALLNQSRNNEMAVFRAQHPDVASFIDGFEGNYSRSDSGIFNHIIESGNGEQIIKGDTMLVHYEGSLANGQIFDSSYERGQPYALKIGVDQVIPGWVETILDMEIGETRIVVIPPELGYGSNGVEGVIPPNAYLIFKIEVVSRM